MLSTDIAELDALRLPMDIVVKGQDELALDYIEIADYMLARGFTTAQINKCFSVWAGRDVVVCKTYRRGLLKSKPRRTDYVK